jgi:hypothetical protein
MVALCVKGVCRAVGLRAMSIPSFQDVVDERELVGYIGGAKLQKRLSLDACGHRSPFGTLRLPHDGSGEPEGQAVGLPYSSQPRTHWVAEERNSTKLYGLATYGICATAELTPDSLTSVSQLREAGMAVCDCTDHLAATRPRRRLSSIGNPRPSAAAVAPTRVSPVVIQAKVN